MGIRALDQWKVMHGHHCNTKMIIMYLIKFLLKYLHTHMKQAHVFFIKPYMTNVVFTNKDLSMFSDHI